MLLDGGVEPERAQATQLANLDLNVVVRQRVVDAQQPRNLWVFDYLKRLNGWQVRPESRAQRQPAGRANNSVVCQPLKKSAVLVGLAEFDVSVEQVGRTCRKAHEHVSGWQIWQLCVALRLGDSQGCANRRSTPTQRDKTVSWGHSKARKLRHSAPSAPQNTLLPRCRKDKDRKEGVT